MLRLCKALFALASTVLVGCGGGSGSPQLPGNTAASPTPTPAASVVVTPVATPIASPRPVFSTTQARENLGFAKRQTLTMIDTLRAQEKLVLPRQCDSADAVCFPRYLDGERIHMSRPSLWTNGFWPGMIWKILAAEAWIDDFSTEEKAQLLATAQAYTEALFSEAERTNTHDLGFILFDSLGEALNYTALNDDTRSRYEQVLATGRRSLATRFSEDFGVIRSWDWTPRFRTSYLENGIERLKTFDLADPWQYPVIIDNLMNLEFLLTSDNSAHHDIALSHAQQTLENHYHFLDNDTAQSHPIAFHVFDYVSRRPGNWQGLGNISAWSRGQGWSLYGYVSITEMLAQNNLPVDQLAGFLAHTRALVASLKLLMADDYVPPWDFFADNENAASIAANTSTQTTVYSRILDLCQYQIGDDVLPYVGYSPIEFETSILAPSSVDELASYQSVDNEDLIVGDKVIPCGTAAYNLEGRSIPKDSSAAAIIASALYRLAQSTLDDAERDDYILFADNIMAVLSADYLSTAGPSSDLGFMLRAASGNLPAGSEIDTSIIYADFYFVEANIRKLALAR